MTTLAAEINAAGRIIDRALAKGYTVSVNDGEEWTTKHSSNRGIIMAALASTDSDILLIRDANGRRLGLIFLVWGNSPEEVVCDCSDKPEILELVAEN
jgi:hypothetical protein